MRIDVEVKMYDPVMWGKRRGQWNIPGRGGGQNGFRLLMAKAIVIKATKQIFLLPAARRRSVI